MEYTKEYCIEMHRKMWNAIYKKTKEELKQMDETERTHFLRDLNIMFILEKKREIIKEFLLEGILAAPLDLMDMETKYCNCFACLYAFSKENVDMEENNEEDGKYCRSCPFVWDEAGDHSFQCCDGEYGELEDAQFDSAGALLAAIEMIAELPVREDA